MFDWSNIMVSEPNWIVLIVLSAITGALLKPLLYFFIYLIKRLRKSGIEATWYGYYIISKNKEPFIGKETIEVKKGVFNNYIVYGKSITTENQKYKGVVIEERNYLVVHMKPTKHDEEIVLRLKRLIPGNDEIMYGLWSALDFDGNAAVGPTILSKNELNDQQVNDLIKRIKFKREVNGLVVT